MNYKVLTGLVMFLTIVLSSCKTSDSDIKATNQFQGEQTKYWYEILNFGQEEGDDTDYEFANFHKKFKDDLLGNKNGDLLPDSLKGLWFMDGNPLPDQTLQLVDVTISKRYKKSKFPGQHILLKVGDPLTFSWANIAKSHDLNSKIISYGYEYEIAFKDCPEDVVKERKAWKMTKATCTAEDREYAVITPHVGWKFINWGIPKFLAHFDMYLRPSESDYLVWERRSKINAAIAKAMGAAKGDVPADGWHRYRFTQILDKEGDKLKSYKRFMDYQEQFVNELTSDDLGSGNITELRRKKLNALLYYKCPNQGATGCESPKVQEEKRKIEPSEKEGKFYLEMPFF